MNTKYICLALSLIASTVFAEIPSEVRSQFKNDIRIMIDVKGGNTSSEEQISTAIDSMVDDAIKQHPTAFQFTPEEIEAFRSNGTLYTDSQIKESYNNLKMLADGRPMPLLTETYFKLFDNGSLTPKQKIVFQKLTLAIIECTKKQLQK